MNPPRTGPLQSSPDSVREVVQSTRKDIAQGAAELRVDDFVDTFLRESHPEDALSEPVTVPRPAAPTKTVKMQALTPAPPAPPPYPSGPPPLPSAPPARAASERPGGTMMMAAIPEAVPLPASLPPAAPLAPGPLGAHPSPPHPAAALIPPAPMAAPKPRSRAPLILALAVAALALAGGAAILIVGPTRGAGSAPASAAPSEPARERAGATAAGTTTALTAAPTTETTATATSALGAGSATSIAASPSTPAPSASSEPTASAAQASAAPVTSASEPVAGLLSFQAYLTVESTPGLDVVVQGVVVGKTNEKNLVRCGPRNVRLREPGGGRFRTAGHATQLSCMKHVTLALAADP